jgi:hypothetical protein
MGGGESNSSRKGYAWQVKNLEVYMVERPWELQMRESSMIRFSDNDYEGIFWPHNNALGVALTIANHNVHQVLVDTGSSVDILYYSVFKKLKLSRNRIVPANFSLMGFAGEQVHLVGSIELLLTAESVRSG